MTGRKAQLTFFLGFQCQRLHKNYQFYCPIKKRHFLRKIGFRENVGFTGFLIFFLRDTIKLCPVLLRTCNRTIKTSSKTL